MGAIEGEAAQEMNERMATFSRSSCQRSKAPSLRA
jgi:hypothetical protein